MLRDCYRAGRCIVRLSGGNRCVAQSLLVARPSTRPVKWKDLRVEKLIWMKSRGHLHNVRYGGCAVDCVCKNVDRDETERMHGLVDVCLEYVHARDAW